MIPSKLFRPRATAQPPPHARKRRFAVLCAAVLVLIASVARSQSPAPQGTAAGFFRSITGEWIGACEQSTDGEKADNKYFHAVIRQLDDNTFESNFRYYRLDKNTGEAISIGESAVSTEIEPDGTAKNRVTGKGTVLVYEESKNQTHDLTEVLATTGENTLQGKGSGTISVSGMPFGLGKNGKIENAGSVWSLTNGVLSIRQTIKVGFRVLLFKKRFDVVADYTARRGSDLAALMKETRISAKPQ